jgi:hypothetical protein
MLAEAMKTELVAAEEMIWASDWRFGGVDGHLDLGGFMAAVLLFCDKVHGKLPPPPQHSPPTGVSPHWPKSISEPQNPPPELLPGSAPHYDELTPFSAVHSSDEPESPKSPQWSSPVPQDKSGDRVSARDKNHDKMVPTRVSVRPSAFEKTDMPVITHRAKLHLLLDEPNSSVAAKGVSTFCGANILASVLLMVLEPMVSGPRWSMEPEERAVWVSMEMYFTFLFTAEFFLRLAVADAVEDHTMWDFIKNPRNICDFVAILPWYVETVLGDALKAFRLLRIIRLTRLSRLARISRLAKHFPLAAPISMVLVVVWGIFLLHDPNGDL